MLTRFKFGLERLTGLTIYRTPPAGFDLASDLRRWAPRLDPRTVFDVGANIGQTVTAFARDYPGAEIHCFEPEPACSGNWNGG